eukprot:7684506-Pyramimonas_sp.AAC.1
MPGRSVPAQFLVFYLSPKICLWGNTPGPKLACARSLLEAAGPGGGPFGPLARRAAGAAVLLAA